jgi:hypothetical protein
MLDKLDEVLDERVKALGKIERDKLSVARAYNKKVKENCFKSEILFGRGFFLSGVEATGSENCRQIRRDHIESRKYFQEILIWFRTYKGPRCQGHLMGST